MNCRCGVEPGAPVVYLAQEIKKLSNVTFKGIQCYQGYDTCVKYLSGMPLLLFCKQAVNKKVPGGQ